MSGPAYSLGTLSSLSPVSTEDEKILTSPAVNCTRMARERSSANCETRSLADGFTARLKNAISDHLPFDENTGLPPAAGHAAASRSWYDHARAYTEMKWPDLAATSRRSAAEALTTVTEALAPRRRGAPDPEILRRALFAWAFNPGTRNLSPPAGITAALDWIAATSQPVSA